MTIRWQAEAVWEAVVPLLPDFTIEILPRIDSTNTELMRRARAGQLEPTLLVAERQTTGRGRLGRDWQSDIDAGLATLTFSLGMALRPADWSGLSLAVGLSVVQSLHPELKLKWPNDVWLQERKLAGILIETASLGDVRYAVIGIGINLLPRDSDGLRTPAAALQELLPDIDGPAALQAVVLPLVRAVQSFEQHGFAARRSAFHERDLLYGREVQCSDGTTGTARGVDAGGALLVHTANGLQKISSAEVSVRPAPPPLPAAASPTDTWSPMLRPLALILLLANGLYFAWSGGLLAGYGFAPAQQGEPQRLTQQVAPEALRVLSPAEFQNVEEQVKQDLAPKECLTAGPFDATQGAALRTVLTQTLPTGSWALDETPVSARWIVYMGKYAGSDVLAKKRSEVTAMNLKIESLTNATLEPGFSLGGFETKADADAALTRLGGKGLHTARVVQERQAGSAYQLKLPAVGPALTPKLADLRSALGGQTLHSCN